MIFLAGEEYAVRTRIGRCSGRGSEESAWDSSREREGLWFWESCRCGEERSPGDWRCYNEARYSLCATILHFSKFVVITYSLVRHFSL